MGLPAVRYLFEIDFRALIVYIGELYPQVYFVQNARLFYRELKRPEVKHIQVVEIYGIYLFFCGIEIEIYLYRLSADDERDFRVFRGFVLLGNEVEKEDQCQNSGRARDKKRRFKEAAFFCLFLGGY